MISKGLYFVIIHAYQQITIRELYDLDNMLRLYISLSDQLIQVLSYPSLFQIKTSSRSFDFHYLYEFLITVDNKVL